MTVTDSDGADTVQAQTDVEGAYGTFSIKTNGEWEYELDNTDDDTNALAAGATAEDAFAIAAADGTAGTVTVTVTGANDAPTVNAAPRIGPVAAQSLMVGETRAVTLTVADDDGDAVRYRAVSSESSMATVAPVRYAPYVAGASAVVLAGVSVGETVVTVTASDGEAEGTARFRVRVMARPALMLPPPALSASLGAAGPVEEGTVLRVPVVLSSAPEPDETVRVHYAVGAAQDTASASDWRASGDALVLGRARTGG